MFMLRMARRDMMASVTAFLNCLQGDRSPVGSMEPEPEPAPEPNSPHGQVHGADSEEGERVDFDHDGHEGHVEQDLDEAWGKEARQGLALGQSWVGRAGMGIPRLSRPRSWPSRDWLRWDGISNVFCSSSSPRAAP